MLGKKLFYILLILILTFIAYGPARNAKLTNWDDDKYITNNVDITSFKKYKSNLLTKNYEGNYHPLTMLSFAYDYSVGKLSPKSYHRTSIVFHLINSILVFWLILLITNNLEIGLICGVLFGIHPMQVESVAWVSERKNVLFAMFFLASLIAYLNYLKEYKSKFYIIALFLFALSLLSKATAVSLTITLLAIDYFYSRNLLSKKVILEKIPFFALSIFFGVLAIYMQPLDQQELDMYRMAHINNPFYEKVLYATYNLGIYFVKLIIPYEFAVFYPYPEKLNGLLPIQYYILPILVIGLLILTLVLLIKKKLSNPKLILLSLLFFIINIGLLLQLLPVGDAIRADRYAYIPALGVFLLIGVIYQYTLGKTSMRNIFVVVLAGYSIGLAYLTYDRCKVWHDSVSLWTDEIKKYPDLSMAYNNRGIAKHDLEDLDGAMVDYKKSIELDSTFYKAYNNKGIVESIRGDYKTSIKDFDKAISLNKNYMEAYENRGRLKYLSEDYRGAIQDYSTYLKFNPRDYQAYQSRGLAKFYLNDYPNALKDLDKVIELQPDYAEAYSNRGVIKSILNDSQGAINDFNKVVEIDPTYNAAYYNRAKVKFLMGKNADACADLAKAHQFGHPDAGKDLNQYCK